MQMAGFFFYCEYCHTKKEKKKRPRYWDGSEVDILHHLCPCLSFNINLIAFLLLLMLHKMLANKKKEWGKTKETFYEDFKSYFQPLMENNVDESWCTNWLGIMITIRTHSITWSLSITLNKLATNSIILL